MALSMAKAAPLKPEIRLAQALSEFEAVLSDDKKTQLRAYCRQSPPNPTDVMRFTAEIDKDACRNRKSRHCVGTRFTNVLHAIQQFSAVVDVIVGGSQSQIASAIWGTVKMSLQLASAISSYFDQLSTLFMRIGRTCPRHQDFELLYPESTRLQSSLCEYFVVIVRLCKQAVLFLKKPFWSQLRSSISNPFESEFGGFQQDLENLASTVREEVLLASNQAQQNEATEMSKFRALAKKFADTSTRDLEEAKTRRRKKAELLFLNACSVYDYEKSWKQARKQGNTDWICHEERYKQWKQEKVSSTLWCTGILGSGKTVLSANVVEDLRISTSAVVTYFFCRHDEAKSLQTRTIIGSIARQIFGHIKPNLVDATAEISSGTIDVDQILGYIQRLLPSNSHRYFIVIDGLDECEEKEARMVLQCLKRLLESKQVFRVYCSSRPDVFHWTSALLEPQWNIFMSQTNSNIVEYIEDTLGHRLESGSLFVGNPTIILTIRDALLEKAHGMFLWVAFQIDSICSQKTDAAILTALEDLPKDLPDTFNRILRKLQHSNTADPYFCKRIFQLVVAARRPLTLEELREAVSVEPGKTNWDASKLINEILKSLLDSCGSLMTIDEEQLTVHFAHHSVKQHLLSAPMDLDLESYHINMEDANLFLGNIIVTYLNYGIFDSELTNVNSTTLPLEIDYLSGILGNLSRSKTLNRLAVKLLKSKGDSRSDIHSQLKSAAGIVDRSKEHSQGDHFFLPYAQEYWLFHTKAFIRGRADGYTLWQGLADGRVNTVQLPWEWTVHEDERTKMIKWMKWSIQNDHWALIDRILVKIKGDQRHDEALKPLLEFLASNLIIKDVLDMNLASELSKAPYLNKKLVLLLSLGGRTDISASYEHQGNALQAALSSHNDEIARLLLRDGEINAEGGEDGNALQAASLYSHREIVRLLLKNGADVNAEGGKHGNALQAASLYGHREIVRLLLKNGANVNAEGGYHGNALQAASADGHEEIARLLLDNGANVNAQGGFYGSALQAASVYGHEEIARLLLENGANVNAERGYYGNALQAASVKGREEIVRLLLENGANVNAESGRYGSALQAASLDGYEEIARLLLENGANVNAEGGYYGNALQAASARGYENMAMLLLENGANVNARGENNKTALEVAIWDDKMATVQLLLDRGATVSQTSVEAADFGSEEVRRLIRDALA